MLDRFHVEISLPEGLPVSDHAMIFQENRRVIPDERFHRFAEFFTPGMRIRRQWHFPQGEDQFGTDCIGESQARRCESRIAD